MAQPQPPQQQEPTPLPPRIPLLHNAAIAGAIIAPLVMLMPPRRMDIRFFVLAGTFSLATNQLAYEYTGTSIYHRFGNRATAIFGGALEGGLPEGAKRTQQLLREQRDRQAAEKKQEESKASGLAALGKDIWLGAEEEGWQKRRAEEHRKKIEEGQGISDIIMEQISDVFSGKWRGDAAKKDENNDESKPNDAERSEKK